MTRRKLEAYRRLYDALEGMGFEVEEIKSLLRIESTLHRWAEHECNGNIQRDKETGKPKWWSTDPGCCMSCNGWSIPDRERGALKRLHALMAKHPGLVAYHQGDPRGCALYILRPKDIIAGRDIDSYYNRGIAVCI